MMRRGDICIWHKRNADGSVSRILCSVVNRTSKNVEISRWKSSRYIKVWATPESLQPATEREKEEYWRQIEEREKRLCKAAQ